MFKEVISINWFILFQVYCIGLLIGTLAVYNWNEMADLKSPVESYRGYYSDSNMYDDDEDEYEEEENVEFNFAFVFLMIINGIASIVFATTLYLGVLWVCKQ